MADEPKKPKKPATEEKDKENTDKPAEATEVLVEEEAAKELATIEENPQRPVVTIADVNQIVLGELVLSYAARDVTLILDGATAARVIAAFARPERRGRLQDFLDVENSSMRNSWTTFDLDNNLLAVSWYPGLPSKATGRMTVDPPSTTAGVEGAEHGEAG